VVKINELDFLGWLRRKGEGIWHPKKKAGIPRQLMLVLERGRRALV
jgi:hypothetical protein